MLVFTAVRLVFSKSTLWMDAASVGSREEIFESTESSTRCTCVCVALVSKFHRAPSSNASAHQHGNDVQHACVAIGSIAPVDSVNTSPTFRMSKSSLIC